MKYESRLTAKFIENLKEPGKYFDGHGLFIEVTKSGTKLWKMKYRIAGKEKRIEKLDSLGAWPDVSLKEARRKADEAREKLKAGLDPVHEKKKLKEAAKAEELHKMTFRKVALEWHTVKTADYAPGYRKQLLSRIEKLLLPYIGDMALSDIEPGDIIQACKHTEQRGCIEQAHRLLQLAGQIFRYARACGYTKVNTAAELTEALTPLPKDKPRAALTDPREIMHLLQAIDAYPGYASILYALKILPYVAVRSQEIRGARWAEIDLDKGTWIIPAERMKMKEPHIVPLSRQVRALFQELKSWTGSGELCFPSAQGKGKMITPEGLLQGIRRLGYGKEEMSVHGFRSMASTILNQAAAYRPDVIEAQLAHAERNKVRAAYNRTDYLEERRSMMQDWADYLDSLRAGNVQSMKDWITDRKERQGK